MGACERGGKAQLTEPGAQGAGPVAARGLGGGAGDHGGGAGGIATTGQ